MGCATFASRWENKRRVSWEMGQDPESWDQVIDWSNVRRIASQSRIEKGCQTGLARRIDSGISKIHASLEWLESSATESFTGDYGRMR